jgi:hypothetical protein
MVPERSAWRARVCVTANVCRPLLVRRFKALSRGDPDAAVSGNRRRSHAILVETVERTSGLERVLGQAQQAAAHPDPDVVVAIPIERPRRSPHAMLVFDRLEQGM